MWRRSTRDRSGGQALVELALVLPVFFALVFGLIDLGRVIWANDVVANAAREGARFASVNAGTPGLPDSEETTTAVQATKDEIRQHAIDFMFAGGANTQVSVCFSVVNLGTQVPGCAGNVDEANAGYTKGNLVTVVVESNVPIMFGVFIGRDSITVRGESTVLVNN